jgi:hypothetical protein
LCELFQVPVALRGLGLFPFCLSFQLLHFGAICGRYRGHIGGSKFSVFVLVLISIVNCELSEHILLVFSYLYHFVCFPVIFIG